MKSENLRSAGVPESRRELEYKRSWLYHFITSSRHHVSHSSHLHMPNQMLVDPMVRVVDELLLRLL
jgi:hypothetical protein